MQEASSERDYERQSLISKRSVDNEDDSSYEDESDEESTDPSAPDSVKESFIFTVLNIIKVTVGGCLPFLVHGFKDGGWSTLFVLFGTLVVSGYCAILLGRLQTLRARMLLSYRDIAGRALSKEFSFLVLLFMLSQIYLSLCLNLTTSALSIQLLDSTFSTKFSFLITCLIVIGFLIITNIVDVGIFGVLTNMIPYVFPFYMFACIWLDSVERPSSDEYKLWTNLASISSNFGLSLYCLSAHYTYPTIKAKMQDPDRWDTAVIVSFSFIFLMYSFTGVSAYIAFGDDLKYYGLLNFLDKSGSKVLLVLLILQSLMTFSETLNPFARVIEVYLGINKFNLPTKHLSSFMFRIGLIAAGFAIGYFMRNVYGTVVSLVGVIFCCTTTILFPVLCYIYSHWRSCIPFFERAWLLFCLVASGALIVWNLEHNIPILLGMREDDNIDDY